MKIYIGLSIQKLLYIQHAWGAIIYGEPFVSKWRYKIPCVGVRIKLTRCVLSNRLSTSSGRDRLDVFYRLDFMYGLMIVRPS